jgi:Flp pilus assembly protein TadD
VVKAQPSGRPWADRVFDLRVEDHPRPLDELRRLVRVQRAYNHMGAGDDCVTVKDWACAEREYGAARALEPRNAEMAFWHAVALATGGRLEEARPHFAQAFAADPRWRELLGRLPAVDQLPKDPKLLETILAIR